MDSIWTKTFTIRKRTSLKGDIRADVAVIGGGMTGILTAWQLKQAGVRAVVLEAERIGGGQTGNTTAKVTSQHGMFCHTFIGNKGEETARKYVQANQAAVEEYKRIIRERGISCDLRECDSYVYSADGDTLAKEVEAARKLGVDAVLENQISLPVACAGAVCFHGQAEFHPLKFIGALAEELEIYENTPVKEVEEHLVKTPGGSVRAEDTGKSVKGLTKRFFHMPQETVDELPRGHGGVIDTPQGKTGVYKTEDGQFFQVDIVCPHMGCELTWNPDERSWDCPCHGSRFDYKGNRIDGPAEEGIALESSLE